MKEDSISRRVVPFILPACLLFVGIVSLTIRVLKGQVNFTEPIEEGFKDYGRELEGD